ncbi:hypothetical protein QEZ54_05780 [Catellatospora sp. KI3]|uniref:hypothetical protein n=1 Tax=Catellatospora sp. KI3 TaxID=3041620 RepID=UPI002482DBC5|nr:hypothetical protein [Catellatospora sp. KI3]MDI1460472.1 hypothetical protein [Catellatospora sp. KI3]
MVRHLGSLLLTLIFAPAIFLLTGTGLSAFNTTMAAGGAADAFLDAAAALGALLLAGILYAVLLLVRLSPVGPSLGGLAFLGTSAWALADGRSYQDTFALIDIHLAGAVGQTGLGVLLGVPLLATITSPRRWRRVADPVQAFQQYPPQQYRQPGAAPDPTRQLTSMPADPYALPDIPAPSLHYPRPTPVAAPAGPTMPVPPGPTMPVPAGPTVPVPPQSAPVPPRQPSAPLTPLPDAPPLPRRNPNPPPAAMTPSAPSAPAPSAPVSPAPSAPAAAAPEAGVTVPVPGVTVPVAGVTVPVAGITQPVSPAVPTAPPAASAPSPTAPSPTAPTAPAAGPDAGVTVPVPPAAPPAASPAAPPPLPDESTVMLARPADQQTVKRD